MKKEWIWKARSSRSLAAVLARRESLAVSTAIDIAVGVLKALQRRYDQGGSAFELTPEAVFLDVEWDARVTVRIAPRADPGDRFVAAPGKPRENPFPYLSVERLRGGDRSEAGDVYAVGVLLYECLTGRVPYAGDSKMAVIRSLEKGKRLSLDAHRRELAKMPVLAGVVGRAIRRRVRQRTATIAELLAELESLVPVARRKEGLGVLSGQRPTLWSRWHVDIVAVLEALKGAAIVAAAIGVGRILGGVLVDAVSDSY